LNIAFAIQFLRDLESLFDLGRCERKGVRVATGRSSVHVTRMNEVLGCAPKQADSGALHLALYEVHHLVEVLIGLAQRGAMGCEIPIVERIEGRPKFFAKFKKDRNTALGLIQGISFGSIPGTIPCPPAEHIAAVATHGVPIHHREAEVFLHGSSFDDFVGIIPFEGQRILGLRSFVLNRANFRKCNFRHSVSSYRY
jgi:hypothetical protein